LSYDAPFGKIRIGNIVKRIEIIGGSPSGSPPPENFCEYLTSIKTLLGFYFFVSEKDNITLNFLPFCIRNEATLVPNI